MQQEIGFVYQGLLRAFYVDETVFKVTHPNARQNKSTKENAWSAINRQLQLIFENELPK